MVVRFGRLLQFIYTSAAQMQLPVLVWIKLANSFSMRPFSSQHLYRGLFRDSALALTVIVLGLKK